MSKKIYVEYIQLLKLRDDLDNLLKNNVVDDISNHENATTRKKIDADYELDNVEKKICDYIIDHPGCNKQNIIDNLGTSSRVSILKRIKKLVEFGYIIEKRDEKNNSFHKLHYNDRNSLAILFKDLKKFKDFYFLLLENIKPILIELNKRIKKRSRITKEDDYYTDDNDTSIGDLNALTAYIILPFKILIAFLYLSNFIYFNKNYSEDLVLQKFLIFNEFIKDVIIKFNEISLNISEKKFIKNIRFIEDLEKEILPSTIETNINFFLRYNLTEVAKDLWNSLWVILFPFISQSDFYKRIIIIIEKNSVTSLIQLLEIKKKYQDIEADYKPITYLRL
jgi:hypothetical protein